jgi:molybdopterin converting factor subunit 1
MAAPPLQLVDVLLFASAADAFGADRVRIAVPGGATAAQLQAALIAAAREATGRELPPACRLAVNQRFAPPELPVGSDDEIALIPPVAGG